MKRAIMATILMCCGGWVIFGQSGDTPPGFEAADVHVSGKSNNPNRRAQTGPARGGRYDVKTGTMLDLIRIAYSFDADKIVGGPNWLEMDRFDVIAKAPAEATAETQKLMLQRLLEERFGLVVRRDTRLFPAYTLTVGKTLQLKESDGSGQTGCKLQSGFTPPDGDGGRTVTGNANGSRVSLGPDMTIHYACRNMTMAAFAAGLRGMMGAPPSPNAVSDETGLKGAWNFDLQYAINTTGRMPIFDALDKQLGLILEAKQVPAPVLVVDKVNRTPSENPPGTAEALPANPTTEFEVASLKPADGSARMSRYVMQPGGRLITDGMSLRFLVNRAFNTRNDEQVTGLPRSADTDRYDIVAQAPALRSSTGQVDNELVAPMLRTLLVARFQMKYHWEERQVIAYSLVSAKPKMKKADPASRTSCGASFPVGAPPGSRVLTCQNTGMAQLADMLQNGAPELGWPVLDATGIEGGWDFTLTFGPPAALTTGGSRGGDVDLPAAPDPTGNYTLIEAVEKQLGLKLEKQRRRMPIVVIDHMEQKPSDN